MCQTLGLECSCGGDGGRGALCRWQLGGIEPTSKILCLVGGAVAQQVPVQAIQVHQAPQQASPSRDSSTDLTQTSSSGTGIAPRPSTLPAPAPSSLSPSPSNRKPIYQDPAGLEDVFQTSLDSCLTESHLAGRVP